MWLRAFQFGVVFFWLFAAGWLTWSALRPERAGMLPLDPRRPLDVFFAWNESAQLTLLKDGLRIGQISVAGFDGKPNRPENPAKPGFSVSGTVEKIITDDHGKPVPTVGLSSRNLIEFNEEDLSLHAARFQFRAPAAQLDVEASVGGREEDLQVRATLAGKEIFVYNGSAAKPPVLPNVAGFGFEKMGTGVLREALDSVGDPSQIEVETKAYRGVQRLAGRRFQVYVMEFSIAQFDQKMTVFFSESGEPLQIKTTFGYEALSEVLVPLDAYRID